MGSIIERKRRDGSVSYRAQIVIKEGGAVLHQESRSFDRRVTANAWMKRRESELRAPGGLEVARGSTATLAEAIEAYIADHRRQIGRTKAQVLGAIRAHEIAQTPCRDITSDDIVGWVRELGRERSPSTCSNYLSHLSAVFAVADAAWGMPLDHATAKRAAQACQRLGLIAKSTRRHRRPSLPEIDELMAHFHDRWLRGRSMPMHRVVAFAMFSTRRQEEIVTIRWADLEPAHSRVLVRDMKHPGQKIGNDVWCELPAPALHVVETMRGTDPDRIFPYSTDAVSASFTRACKLLGIEDLRFHDLRHEGVSWQFEQGKTIPQAASVSGHRSWQSLQRYSHIRATGDRWADWSWQGRIGRDA